MEEKLGSEEVEKVTWTIGDDVYDPEDLSNESKVHFTQAIRLRDEIVNLAKQKAHINETIVNAQVALNYRETALRSSITVAEVLKEPELEVADG